MPGPSSHRTQKRIVVVEDDRDIRLLYEEILRGEGFDVLLASNGKEALEILEKIERDPCLVLTDFMMPEMTGSQLVKLLRENDCLLTIPVVMISARPLKEIEDFGVEFLKKPVDVDTIIEKVKKYCGPSDEFCTYHEEKLEKVIEDGDKELNPNNH
jgi:CheY-like chemotaxis protein